MKTRKPIWIDNKTLPNPRNKMIKMKDRSTIAMPLNNAFREEKGMKKVKKENAARKSNCASLSAPFK